MSNIVVAHLADAAQVLEIQLVVWVHLLPITWYFNGAVALDARVLAQQAAEAFFAALPLAVVNAEGLSTSELDDFERLVNVISYHVLTVCSA